MPHAIEWSLATPKMSAVFPSSSPIATLLRLRYAAIMPDRPAPPTDLRAALHGVRALLLDLDGVIVLAGKPVAGAPEALVRPRAAAGSRSGS